MTVLARETPPAYDGSRRRTAVLVVGALTVALVGVQPALGNAAAAPASVQAAPHVPTAAELTALQAQVDAATAEAARESNAVVDAAARAVGLRLALDQVAEERQAAQQDLDAQAVQLYEAQDAATGVPDVASVFASPDLQLLLRMQRNEATGVTKAVADAADAAQRLAALNRQADVLRAGLVARAQRAIAAQDKARALLTQAMAAYDAAAAQARAAAARAAAAAASARLSATLASLDELSGNLAIAVSPVDSARGRQALANQAPVLATLEAAGSGYPAGYRPTGQSITGTSSWYGPGFVGRPTASGAPYDPEQLTCAMLAVPLGTVVHVTNLATGLAVNVLVTDRGPYVGNRVIDLSHAAAVAIGNTGLATVRIEVLSPPA